METEAYLRAVRALRTPMLAAIRDRPGIAHSDALRRLKAEGRIRPGVTLSMAHAACEDLYADGLIEGSTFRGWTAIEKISPEG